MKKYLWIPFALVIPVSLWLALGYGPHWKPFLSPAVSWTLFAVVVIWLTWSTFARKRQ
jgi:hypothetical protein